MRKLYVILTISILSLNLLAQSPQKFKYHAIIHDSSNNIISMSPVGMRFIILQDSATGTQVYVETQKPTTNAQGLISIEIGGGTGFSTIDWSKGSFYLKIEVDPSGGTNYTVIGTSQLLSVPYALFAEKCGSQSLHKKVYKGVIDTLADGDLIKIDSSQECNYPYNYITKYHYKMVSIPEINTDSLPSISVYFKPKIDANWTFPLQTNDMWVEDNVCPQNSAPDYSHCSIIANGKLYIYYKRTMYCKFSPNELGIEFRIKGDFQVVVIY